MSENDFDSRLISTLERQTEAICSQVEMLRIYIEKHDKAIAQISTAMAVKQKECDIHQEQTKDIRTDLYGSSTSAKCSMVETVSDLKKDVDGMKDEMDVLKEGIDKIGEKIDKKNESNLRYIIWFLLVVIGFILAEFSLPALFKAIENHGAEKSPPPIEKTAD